MAAVTPEEIDAVLPQTQCGLCGYGGCMPYAEALIFENAAINLCPPGGVETLKTLGALLKKDTLPFVEGMQQKEKKPSTVIIREEECIGCTKCIQACPVDAIIGTAKQMHAVLTDVCTGCDLCLPTCPVDCMEVVLQPKQLPTPAISRQRFQIRQVRLKQAASAKRKSTVNENQNKSYLLAAIERAKTKKLKD